MFDWVLNVPLLKNCKSGLFLIRIIEVFLEPCQTSMMKHFRENSERLKTEFKFIQLIQSAELKVHYQVSHNL